MNQISTTTFGFVRKVMHIYGPIFQQDKYGMRQDFPGVNTVNNKRLRQEKLRNDLILAQLYRYAKMPPSKLSNKLPVSSTHLRMKRVQGRLIFQ